MKKRLIKINKTGNPLQYQGKIKKKPRTKKFFQETIVIIGRFWVSFTIKKQNA